MNKILTLIIASFLSFFIAIGFLLGTISTEAKRYPTIRGKAELLKVAPSIPVSVVIPKLGVNTIVEQVGETPTGEMDVPSSDFTTGWYSKGAKPGEMGSAVLAGHYDALKGGPGIFYGLSSLETGDQVYIIDARGKEYIFKVVGVVTYPDSEFPLDLVFADKNSKRLNLITCEGTYNSTTEEYTDRLVVFTELVENPRVINNI